MEVDGVGRYADDAATADGSKPKPMRRQAHRYRYLLGSGLAVPDPASRSQADDVHGPSVVVDPRAYRWRNPSWRGRPWHETVLYELHAGLSADSPASPRRARRLANSALPPSS